MKKCVLLTSLFLTGSSARAQQPPSTVLHTETRVVLVDSVVTDKKGNYVRDLTQSDFHVFEDNKEQAITSFSFEAAASSAAKPQIHHTVLFFDNSNVSDASNQPRVRSEAIKFVEANVSPNRMIAVINFGSSLQIAQNFTSDVERLKSVINGVKPAGTPAGDVSSAAAPLLAQAASDFGARSMILALRSVARSLSQVQGRKTVVLLSPGFKYRPEEQNAEMNATLVECAHANVAIYAVDVRGLVAGTPKAALEPDPFLRNAAYNHAALTFAQSFFYFFQARPATGAVGTNGDWANPRNIASMAIPDVKDSSLTNLEVLLALSNGSGGFLIKNTNDLAGGMAKIGKEQDEYYLLGYTPPDTEDSGCHKLRVTVSRAGATVRSRAGYCGSDVLSHRNPLLDNGAEKELESLTVAGGTGPTTLLAAPFFYTATNMARVDVVMEIPINKLKSEPLKGRLHTEINLLGIAYRKDGSIGARFTDRVKRDFDDQKGLDAYTAKPLHYEYQFDIAPGDYTLKVAYSLGGGEFGKAESPLAPEPYTPAKFALSGVALSRRYAPLNDARAYLDAEWVEGRVPLIAAGTFIVPSGSNRFKTAEPAVLYAEVYEPLLAAEPDPKNPVAVAVAIRILDRKSGAEALDTGLMRVPLPDKTGNPVLPIVVKMPISGLPAGAYVLELEAGDVTGRAVRRLMNIDIE